MRSKIIQYLILAGLVISGVFAYQYWNFRWPEKILFKPYDFSLRETKNVKHTVDLADLLGAGVLRDSIPAINDPQFESVGAADIYLKDDGYGIDLEINGQHRFYPYQILVWHEVVNDEFNSRPILITYCPLCESGLVFNRMIEGEIHEFGTTGKVWNNNLIMYDRQTETMWSQLLAQGIVGELAGTSLEIIPTHAMTWQVWKRAYPHGEVLTRETGADRDYTRDPYGDYYQNLEIKFTLTNNDARLAAKQRILGVKGRAQTAYLRAAVSGEGVINDEVGGQATVLAYDSQTDTARVFLREVDGQILTFSQNSGKLIDEETQSQWNFQGQAETGEWAGYQLKELPVIPAFWFCWVAAYPKTNLHLP